MVDRTTIIVAHHLSTVRNTDNIVVIHQGKNVEEAINKYISLSRMLHTLAPLERVSLLLMNPLEQSASISQELMLIM
ncbi:hypothetical protein P3S67_028886 [Capsicum chacoense]